MAPEVPPHGDPTTEHLAVPASQVCGHPELNNSTPSLSEASSEVARSFGGSERGLVEQQSKATLKPTESHSSLVASNAGPADPSGQAPREEKPLRSYYEHLLTYRDGKLVKPRTPFLMSLRSAEWYLTAVVCIGIMSDLIAFVIIVPVLPFRLQELGYSNVSALMSWLLFAYSAGIVIFTIPVAIFFHRYPWRRGPLILAVLGLEASFVLFMFAKPFWAMVISRVIQGGCNTVVWTVGLALICENINPARLGTHLGVALTGLSIGVVVAPPIGGSLYKHMGWYAPFIFCIILCGVDTVFRIAVLEVSNVAKVRAQVAAWEEEAVKAEKVAMGEISVPEKTEPLDLADKIKQFEVPVREKPVELPLYKVFIELCRLPRGVVALMLVAIFGFIVGCYDSIVALRVELLWNKDAYFVGMLYLAAAVPAFFAGPCAGLLADKKGAEWVILPCVILCLPWLPLLTIKTSLPLFMASYAMTFVVITGLNAVASLELAAVSTFTPGVSEIHQFAAMNIAYAVSSAAGAVVGGQIYAHVKNGWDVVCWVGLASFVLCIPPPLIWTGKIPLWSRLRGTPPPRSGIPPEEREYWDKKARGEDPEAAVLEGSETDHEHDRHSVRSGSTVSFSAVAAPQK